MAGNSTPGPAGERVHLEIGGFHVVCCSDNRNREGGRGREALKDAILEIGSSSYNNERHSKRNRIADFRRRNLFLPKANFVSKL